MNYADLIKRALHDRSVNKAAKEMGISQPSLHRYEQGERLPKYAETLILAREAQISGEEALRIVAIEDAKRRGMLDRIKSVFPKPLNALNRGRFQRA